MKKYLSMMLLLFCLQGADAQQMLFKKLYSTTGPSNQGSAIIQQSNGDFIISGVRSVPLTTGQYIADVFLMRINAAGDTIWTKELGTTTDRELGYNMTQMPNGNLVMVGSINIPPNGASDALIICTDVTGKILWQKQHGGIQNDFATNVAFDGQNLIVCGITESYGAGDSDAWLLKLNPQGDTIWTKTYGGTALDDAWDIEVADNYYYFTGGTYSFANGLYDDAWVVKTDTAGKEIWHKAYGVKDRVDWAWSLTPVKDNGATTGFVFTGIKDSEENQPGNSYGDMHFVKIDTSGKVIWDKSIGGTAGANWRREGFDVQQLPDGSFIACGYKLDPTAQSQQLYMVRTNSMGDVTWDSATGTSDSNYYANALTVTNDGGWAITGAVFHPAQPVRYIYVTRFSPNGVQVIDVAARNDVLVYPNPSTDGVVNVKAENSTEIKKVNLLGIDGKLLQVYERTATGNSIHVNTPATGVYLLQIYTNKGVVHKRVTTTK